MHKAGFVNIIGNPNVGKSSLINLLLGEKISIISEKSQTTRHRIKGILDTLDYQIIFSDTPGILVPQYKLHKVMLNTVVSTLADADILLYMTAVNDIPQKNNLLMDKIRKLNIPILLIINKIDLLKSTKPLDIEINKWRNIFPNSSIIPISCLKNFNINAVLEKIIEVLPKHPPYYPKKNNAISDSPLRFFIAEIIREKIFKCYRKEIPYATNVVITNYKSENSLVKIAAKIYVERESQKGILIGEKGYSLKKIGTLARKEIEKFIKRKVYLELWVVVEKNWRNKSEKLKKFGYIS